MLIIGLAGGSGSGKGVVCSIFEKMGLKTIDTDKIYRKMTSPGGECLPALAEEFGFGIILADGSLNRKALARLIFAGDGAEKRKARLEEITHKMILDRVRELIREYRKDKSIPAVVVDAPLLFESGFNKECDTVIGVIAEKDIRIKRILERDGITEEQAKQRIAAQHSDDYIRYNSNYIISNNSSVDYLELQISHITKKILLNEE